MKRILITGATGNIGKQVIHYLKSKEVKIITGLRNPVLNNGLSSEAPDITTVKFDFEATSTFENALQNIDTLFLLRPPHLSDISIFKPLINTAQKCKIKEIMFLSVQGAEKSKIIPHNKIERLILQSGIDHIFIRPSYFMQNLTTTLLHDIQNHQKIVLPAGHANFNWIDVDNIAEICAKLLVNFQNWKNKAIEITGYENVNFQHVTRLINESLNTHLIYEDLNPLSFYFRKRKEGELSGKILVMIMLHYLPRFSKDPQISNIYEEITGNRPTTLKEFIQRERSFFV